MKELFDKFLMYFCFAGIGTIAVVAFVRVTLPAAATKARGVARQARKAGPAVIIPVLCVAGLIVYGSTKSNSPTNEPPAQTQMIMQPGQLVEQRFDKIASEVVEVSPVQKVGEAALQSVESVEPPASNALVRVEKWWRRGAYNNGQILTFDEDWCFPYGTNHLTSVEVWASGAVYPSMKNPTPIVGLATKLSVAPQDTEVYMGRTTNNTYRIEWHGGHPNRDLNQTADASIELFRNGNIIVTEGGVETLIPYDIPFEHDGFGHDEDWVRANFTNAEEIISIGYADWVDRQVGVGLTNGLYKFSAEFLEDPPEPTELYIGDYSVCVTNAGVYSFVLEKGEEYEFGTWPFNDDVDYWAQDDLAVDAPMLTAWWGGWESPGEWTIDGGWNWFWRPDLFEWGYQNGYCCMMPTLQGSPAVTHLGPDDFPATFEAVLSDIPQNCEVSYEWSADAECLDIESPRSKITQVRPKNMPSWNSTSMSVTSRFKNKSLTSTVSSLTYGTNSIPTAKLTLSFPDVTFLNDDLRSDRVYPLDVHFSMEVPTNGTIRISHSGDDQVIVSDTNSFSKVYSNPCVTFSSKGKKTGLTRRFYVLSRNVGTGSFTATCELADRSRIVQQKGYSVIEPICHYVCNRKGDEGRFLNPSRLVYGTNSYFEVEVRGPYVKTQLVWSVTSGMCDTTKMAWNKVRLKPNVTNGVVKLTAKFTNDGHQPCFELPIVTPRVIPVRAFTVPPRRGAVPVSPTRIRRCLALANEIYSQVGVSFNLISITQNIRTTNDWVVAEYDVDPRTSPTNSPTVSAQALSLLNHYTANDCLELYFVGQIRNSGAVAFRHPKGIVISQEATDHSVAHEIGHAFGLLDIYDYSDVNARVHEQFKSIKPSRGKFSSSRDWGDTFGRGFYPKEVSHSTLMRRMLMFGKDGEASLDIPDGAVFSLQHNHTQSISQTNMPPVGASFMIQSNRGVYSK